MKSLITGDSVTFLFRADVLGKFPVSYYRCDKTGFIQTESPYWLDEAYSTAITALDVGLVQRNLNVSTLTMGLIEKWKLTGNRFVDFGGGYGVFTRLMRDAGYPFLHFEKRCSNLFAAGFEADFQSDGDACRYDLLTAWEVFEHLVDPIATIEQMTSRSERVLFSTTLVPSHPIRQATDWWYFTPQTGQHIAFYTVDALHFIANKLSCHFYTDGIAFHLFTRHPLSKDPFQPSTSERILKRCFGIPVAKNHRPHKRKSLLELDFQAACARLKALQLEANERGELR